MTKLASFALDHGDVPGLRDVVLELAGIGYSERLLSKRLGVEDLAELQWRGLPIYRSERLADRDPLALAIDLFLLQHHEFASKEMVSDSRLRNLPATGELLIFGTHRKSSFKSRRRPSCLPSPSFTAKMRMGSPCLTSRIATFATTLSGIPLTA
jgi:hypothetical protein